MVKMKLHPTLGIMVRSDGLILIPATKHSKEHWTYGSKDADGYCRICVNYKTYLVHRLVAETFLPNPDNKPVIDHIKREETSNNDVSNLRWATVSENALNKKNNLPNAANLTKAEAHNISNKKWNEKNKDYYKSEEYKLKKKLYYQKRKEAKCV